MQILHRCTWSEWYKSHWNSHIWRHVRTEERNCRECGQIEERLLELFCPAYKKTGEYCRECLKYSEKWEGRHIDFYQQIDDNTDMEQTKQKPKRGRPAMLERNIAMAIEYEFYPKLGIRGVGKKYGITDPKTAFTAIANGRKYIDMKKVKESVG